MRLKSHPIFLIAFSLGILLAFGKSIQHGWHLRSQTIFAQPSNDPRLVLKQATIVGWDLGKRLWEFSGDELTVDHDNHYLNYKGHGVGKLFFNNKPFVSIYAPRLRYDLFLKNASAFQGVRLYANPSTVLVADALMWNQTSQQLFIPGKVKIESPYGSFNGRRLLLIAYEGRVKMSDVRMSVKVKAPGELAHFLSKTHE